MSPAEFMKELKTLKDLAIKQGNRKGEKWIAELSFWGTAKQELEQTLRELRAQKKMI